MMSHLVSQLTDLGLENRLPEVLEEASKVRAELGYPVLVTPFSQFVGVQAFFNVMEGERYKTVPQGLKEYARGGYGQPAAPIDPNVLDKILGDGERTPIDPLENMMDPMVRKVRAEKGPFESDEKLLLYIFNTEQTLDKFRRNKKPIEIPVLRQPLGSLLKEVSNRRHIRNFFLQKNGVNVEVKF
jgi:pyruvate/oxaloacetate carboxyltransferase